MSVSRTFTIHCDGCGAVDDIAINVECGGGKYVEPRAIRIRLTAKGWTRAGEVDHCGDCSADPDHFAKLA